VNIVGYLLVSLSLRIFIIESGFVGNNMQNRRVLIAAGLGVVVIIAILVGLFSNDWVTAKWEAKPTGGDPTQSNGEIGGMGTIGSGERHYGLREIRTVDGEGHNEFMDLSDYAEAIRQTSRDPMNETAGEDAEDMNTAGLRAYIILWISLVVCIGAMVFTILCGLNKMSEKSGIMLGFVGGGLILLANILYTVMTPEFIEDMNMGFGWSFYLVIFGGVIQCVAGGLMIGVKEEGTQMECGED